MCTKTPSEEKTHKVTVAVSHPHPTFNMHLSFTGSFRPTAGLTYDFPPPPLQPVIDFNGCWPKMSNVIPGSYLCYSNKTKTDPTWIDRCRTPDIEEMALRICNKQMVITEELNEISGETDTNYETYADVHLWLDPFDAHLKECCFPIYDDVFYYIRDRILNKWGERRYAADWHPQIRVTSGIVDRCKLFDVVNKKAKEAMKGRANRKLLFKKKK